MMAVLVSVQVGSPEYEGTVGRAEMSLMKRAARAALQAMGIAGAELSMTLLGDDEMAALNQRWLGHTGPTDVISFPLFEAGEKPVGDIYIGVLQAERQATELGVPIGEELARLAIHGTLHVLGLDHPAGKARESSTMWKTQERILEELMKA